MLPFAHGVDLVKIDRIEQMLAAHEERFLERCFTPAEQQYAGDHRRRAEHLAARFAAKEAGMKALGTGLSGGVSWTDFEVVRLAAGQPILVVTGVASEIAGRLGITRWLISLTHTDTDALASVIAIADPK